MPIFFRYYFPVFLFLVLPFIVSAQLSISGKVVDKTSLIPLAGVTVNIYKASDSVKVQSKTDREGSYNLKGLKSGRYNVTTNLIGYKSDFSVVELVDKSIVQSFTLEPSEIVIDEIEVVARQAVVLKGDTIEFDAGQFSTSEYADADELIAQVPGVQLDEDGNVKAQGEDVHRIIVDGKEFFSTDPKVALKMLPAEIISKIQIIDEKSEQARFSGFDDGERRKVINIVTKPDRRKGYFGRAIAGKGSTDKFSINTNLSAFDGSRRFSMLLMGNNINETNAMEMGRGRFGSGGGNNQNTERGIADTYIGTASFNDSFLGEKMEVSADYRFRSNNTETNTISNIEYLMGARANQLQDRTQFSDQQVYEHQANGRIKWDVDSSNRIDFNPNISFSKNSRFNTNSGSTVSGKAPVNTTDRSNTTDNSNFSIGGDLTYMHRFDKPGRTISLNLNGNKNSNDALGLNLATTSYYEDAVWNRTDTNNNQSITNGYGSGFNTRLSLTENITRLSRLQLNYGYRNTVSYSDRETFEFLVETGQLGELRDRLSNEFRNDFNFHSGGLSYSYNKRDSLRIQVGLNYQYGIRNNDRTVPVNLVTRAGFGSLLPDFSVRYSFSREQSLEFNYNTSTNTPNINQLQDFINNQNELRISNGNPDLKQEYAHRFRLQYRDINKTTGRSINSSVNFDFVNDKIVNSVLMTDTTIQLFDDVILGAGGQYSVPVNMDGSYNLQLRNDYGVSMKSLKLNMNLGTNLFFNNNLGFLNGEKTPSRSMGFAQRINLNSNINPDYVFGLNYAINGNYTNNPMNLNPKYHVYTHTISTSAKVTFLKKFLFTSNLLYLYNGGINGGQPIETTIWNASLGIKMLKKQNAELSVRGFDLLNNAQNIRRTVDQISASNITSNTLNRYFLLSFTYNLRSFMGGADNFRDRRSSEGQNMGGGGRRGRF